MRKLFAILIIVFVGFLVAMLLVEALRLAVAAFILNVLGPSAYNFVAGVVSGILNSVGLLGFAGIMAVIGLIGGWTAKHLYTKADWSLRSWGAQRTARDLGATHVTMSSGTTPVGATTRPAPAQPAAAPAAPTPAEPEPAPKEEPKT